MGTDCKSAAFSFGGSNPPAPTKNSNVTNTLEFFFYTSVRHTPRGWIRTAAARHLRPAGKNLPSAGFYCAPTFDSLATSLERISQRCVLPLSAAFPCDGSAACRYPPAPTKNSNVTNTLEFFFYTSVRHTPAGGFEQLRPGALRPTEKISREPSSIKVPFRRQLKRRFFPVFL